MYLHCAYNDYRTWWVTWPGRLAGTGCEVMPGVAAQALPCTACRTELLPRPAPLPMPAGMSAEAHFKGLQHVTGSGLTLTARRCAGALSA